MRFTFSIMKSELCNLKLKLFKFMFLKVIMRFKPKFKMYYLIL